MTVMGLPIWQCTIKIQAIGSSRRWDGTLILWGEQWGGPGFTVVQGDYNADGISDLAVYSDGYWYVKAVDGTLIMYAASWGGEGYDPVGR